MKIRRVPSKKELKKSRGLKGVEAAAPPGISPILRSSWKFANDMSRKFNRELMKDRFKDFLRKLAKRFI